MAPKRFNIYFSAQLLEGVDPSEVRATLAARFKLDERRLEYLFSGQPVAIKKDVDLDTASKYRLAFREAGALVDIRPSKTAAHRPATGTPTAPVLNLAPADGRPLVEPPPLAKVEIDTSALDLDTDPKTPLDPRPQPREPDIDTSGLGLAPQAPLEPPPPPPLPTLDLSGLDLADGDSGPLDPRPPPPPPRIDTSDLELTLEDLPSPPRADHP